MALVKWALATSRHLLWRLLLYGTAVSPYMVCASLHGVTIHGMCQFTWCHHTWYVTVYMVSLIWYVPVYMVSPYMVCASLHGVTIYGMWQTTWCHHIWYVTDYMVSPYMVCDRLHGVTIYGMWQSTWCHHIWYVTDYMLSPQNSNRHCWLLLNFHTVLEILSLRPFHFAFSHAQDTCMFSRRIIHPRPIFISFL